MLRLGAFLKTEDIQNEIRAVEKLCSPNRAHENIVIVLRHGRLRNTPYHFFDMELCNFNLEHYIPLLWEPSALEKINLSSIKEFTVDLSSRIKYIWAIMSQIASGIAFIHFQKEVHRDLKPRNGSQSFTENANVAM